MKKMLIVVGAACALVLGVGGYVNADELAKMAKSIDTIWILVAAFLVFFMQAGFACLEAGFTRAKNASNVIMKGVMDFCITSLVFWAVGYGLMFGADKGGLFGTSNFFMSLAVPGTQEGLWQFAFYMFQVAFAGAAATIVAGAIAERAKFTAYLGYVVAVAAIIYPLVGHWIWGGGWLGKLGMVDFAGSAVVHSVGGWAAFAGAIIIGPRIGKYGLDDRPKAILGHNIPLAALGVFILWFGWFGFNPGSTLSGLNGSIATIAVTTNLAACAGGVGAMLVAWFRYGKPDASMTLNGTLIGLVAITGGCAVVSPVAAMTIGAIAGAIVVLGVILLDKIGVDDPVGAVPVHGMNGVWGTLAVGLWGRKALGATWDGLFSGGGLAQLGVQALGAFTVVAFAMATMAVVFFLIKKTVGLRVSREEELRGLDIGEHGMESYAGFQVFTTT